MIFYFLTEPEYQTMYKTKKMCFDVMNMCCEFEFYRTILKNVEIGRMLQTQFDDPKKIYGGDPIICDLDETCVFALSLTADLCKIQN